MSITFKCKMCGGNLEITENSTVCECEYCGAKQTLPKLTDDRRANLYDRANHFRRNNDYDKAMGIYEQILNDDGTDAEAYWSLVLCRFGIEYVEDPSTHKRVPTVNRAQFTSVFDDADYKSAIEYADDAQREVYKSEAEAINDIQKGILEISNKEEPFDVFICYKETDNNGRRTPDSVLANELYHQLTQEGFKVFFARITLEDKLGSAYEPYIFAALNSAKVMVVLGTKSEYFNAVWVKNEWSRYLSLIKSGAKKMLIPAYKDMDPYDLPDEFSHLQAQDMTKLGFMQDLIRGIKKITAADEPPVVKQETVVVQNEGNANITALLKRAKMSLEDKEFNKVDDFCEQVLNQDAEISEAYLYKLMATLEVSEKDNLRDCAQPFDNDNNYKKAYRYGSAELKSKLEEDNQYIRDRNENARLERIYCKATDIMDSADHEDNYREAKSLYLSITDYKDSSEKAMHCEKKSLDCIYDRGCRIMGYAKTETEYKNAADEFGKILDYKDSNEKQKECYEKAEERRKAFIYELAEKLIQHNTEETLSKAIEQFESIKGYKNAEERIDFCKKKIEEIKEAKAEEERCRVEKAEQEKLAAEKVAKKKKTMVKCIIAFLCLVLVVVFIIIPEINFFMIKTGQFEKGDVIELGKIKWLVLDKSDNSALIISKEIIEYRSYYGVGFNDSTWESSDIRRYLNSSFYNQFPDRVKSIINDTSVENLDNIEYGINGGENTIDKIFLLSIDEANLYFSSPQSRIEYDTEKRSRAWWLRSPGQQQCFAACVESSGYISTAGHSVGAGDGVRPVMWIHFEDSKE